MAIHSRPPVEIDPALFFVPDDVIDVRAQGSDNPDIVEQPQYTDNPDDAEYEDPSLDDSNPSDVNVIQTPQWLSIISQTVRIGSDGRTVIDVLLETEDVMGAEDYELRTTK